MTDFKRLHITPLTPPHLPGVLPPNLLPLAKNISYHTVEAWPEKAYGYVDLPTSEADKLKKRLHGLIFKGFKMKIEEARPERRKRAADLDDTTTPEVERRPKRKRSARKTKDPRIIDGVEIFEGRKVKRGWADTERKKSKGDGEGKNAASIRQTVNTTGSPQCLFKTKIPPGAPPMVREKAKKKNKTSKSGGIVVQEFSNTTKIPSFLREEASADKEKVTVEFVEGKGWMAEDGTVLEAAPQSSRQELATVGTEASKRDMKATRPSTRSTTSVATKAIELPEKEDHGSSATSSDPASDSNDEARTPTRLASLSITRSSPTPTPDSPPIAQVPHPLESLFKRPAPKSTPSTTSTPNNSKSKTKPPPLKPSLELSTSFTFFGPDDGHPNGELNKRLASEDEPRSSIEALKVPQTPFTRQDFRDRSLRSAAPTPDTAAPGKSGFGKVWGSQSPSASDNEGDHHSGISLHDDENIGDEGAEAISGSKEHGEGQLAGKRSEFEKWFWEHRGETNRHWKKMRREALKGKRHESNKRKGAAAAK